ncbi:MAG: DUF2625 family protein [Candidatus Obscuribacterales bacterium]
MADLQKRTLDELINKEEPGWPVVQEWLSEAVNHVEVLPVDLNRRDEALLSVQVTTRSPMGAIVYETGGILVDHGWIRILGSGHPRLSRSIGKWNLEATGVEAGHYPLLLVADDVLGGFFAIDRGDALGKAGEVLYCPPDTSEWESTEGGYSDFIWFCFTGDLEGFYSGFRWDGWESEVQALDGDQGFNVYPPLFAEGGPLGERSRAAVPIKALYTLYAEPDLERS